MSRRDDVWRAFLGRDPNPAEETDKLVLAERLVLGENDPFWGVIAFIYARLPGMAAEQERLRLTKELVDTVSGRLDALPQVIHTAVHEVLDNGSLGIQNLDVKLGEILKQKLTATGFGERASLTLKERLRGYCYSVLYAVASFALIGGLVSGAYGLGHHRAENAFESQQARAVIEAPRIEAWARTWEGHEVYAWAHLNRAGMDPILQCHFGNASRIIHQNGLAICYPSGSGRGYYVREK
ncbi:MAG: hypothetical protein ACLPXB_18705 [Thiobacillaceae bacterium]